MEQNELLQDTPGFMAADLEAVKDSFQEVKDCILQAKLVCPVSFHR